MGSGQRYARRAADDDRSRSLRSHTRDRDRGARLPEIVAQRAESGRVDRLQSQDRVSRRQRDPRGQEAPHEDQDHGEVHQRGRQVLRARQLSIVPLDSGRLAGAADLQAPEKLVLSTDSSRQQVDRSDI